MRVLLKALAAPDCELKLFRSSVTSTLYWPLPSSATLPGVAEVRISALSGVEIGARPSDSIALALRTGSRIVCAEEVLDEVGLAVPAEQEDEVERFREFLDQISPEDFGTNSQ